MKIFVCVLVFISFFSFFIHPLQAEEAQQEVNYETPCMQAWVDTFQPKMEIKDILGRSSKLTALTVGERVEMTQERIDLAVRKALKKSVKKPKYKINFRDKWQLIKNISLEYNDNLYNQNKPSTGASFRSPSLLETRMRYYLVDEEKGVFFSKEAFNSAIGSSLFAVKNFKDDLTYPHLAESLCKDGESQGDIDQLYITRIVHKYLQSLGSK